MRVKICGITRREDALLAADLGASAIGFVFWPRSARFIDPLEARAIARALPPFVVPVGVFVDQPESRVREIASLVGLGAVQLHGQETPDACLGFPRRVIKALSPMPSVEASRDWPEEIAILLDGGDARRPGGTGQTIDWTAAAAWAAARPIILAGGLRPENVGEAVARVRPAAVDVSSGVERSPGIKDPGRMTALFEALRGVEGAAG
jgi:phosphoribosylanthranilate isomerase